MDIEFALSVARTGLVPLTIFVVGYALQRQVARSGALTELDRAYDAVLAFRAANPSVVRTGRALRADPARLDLQRSLTDDEAVRYEAYAELSAAFCGRAWYYRKRRLIRRRDFEELRDRVRLLVRENEVIFDSFDAKSTSFRECLEEFAVRE